MFYKCTRVNVRVTQTDCNVTRLANLLVNNLLDLCMRSKINTRICHTMYQCNLSMSMCTRIVSHHPNSSIAHSCGWQSTSNSGYSLKRISKDTAFLAICLRVLRSAPYDLDVLVI